MVITQQKAIVVITCIYIHTPQIHNDDGVWVRLAPDSLKDWCRVSVSPEQEAWALQYNQHLGKTLLVPVDEPKSILDEIIKETIRRRYPELASRERGKARKGWLDCYVLVSLFCNQIKAFYSVAFY